MKEIITSAKTIPLKINGVEYSMMKPKLGHQLMLEVSVDGKGTFGKAIDYLVGLGLPENVAKELDADEYLEIIRYLSDTKKN